MTSATDSAHPTDGPSADFELDAVVLGAGVAGLHQLREQGLPVRAYEAGTDVARPGTGEPLPRRPLRLRGVQLPVPLLRRALQGLELAGERSSRACPGSSSGCTT
jgi:hypothetical protein